MSKSTSKSEHYASFFERLREARESIGASQSVAAASISRMGAAVSPGQISSWERGNSRPSIDELAAISAAYGVSAHWLVTGLGPKSKAAVESNIALITQAPMTDADLAALARRTPSERLQKAADMARVREEFFARIKSAVSAFRKVAGDDQDIDRLMERLNEEMAQLPTDEEATEWFVERILDPTMRGGPGETPAPSEPKNERQRKSG